MIYGLIIADIIMGAVFGLTFFRLPPQIPLFYSRPWGEDQLADLWFIFLLPLLMHIFFFVNTFIAKKYFKESAFITKLIYCFNWFIIITFTGIFLKIIVLMF